MTFTRSTIRRGPKTSAKIYPDDVPNEVKKDRLKKVQTLQREISLAKNRKRIGDCEEVLVDGPSKLKTEQVMGRTRANRIVNLAGSTRLIGEFVQVRITSATANSLLGEPMCANAAIESRHEGDRRSARNQTASNVRRAGD